MYNNIGQTVWAKKLTEYIQGVETIDMVSLSAGAYIIHVKMNGSVEDYPLYEDVIAGRYFQINFDTFDYSVND